MDPDFMHVSTSVKYWDKVGQQFYTKYAGIEKLYQKHLQIISQKKPLVGPSGREWLIEMDTDWKGELKLPETKCVNYPVQGTGADVMMIARISFWNRVKKLKLDKEILPVSTVHDSLIIDAPSKHLELVSNLYYQVFRDLPKNIKKLFNYDWIVPLTCEVKAGMKLKPRWAKLPDGTLLEQCPGGMEEIKVK